MATEIRETVETERRINRYRAAARMLQKWLVQEDDYDNAVWPEVEKELKEARTVCREPDEPTS